MMRRGLTLVETIIALAIIAIAFSILATAFVGNVRVSGTAGERTQSTQYLSYLGRLVAGGGVAGGAAVLPAAEGSISWDYGALVEAFPDLPSQAGQRGDAARYRAEVEHLGAVGFLGGSGVEYRITVCSTTVTGESCTVGVTVGPPRAETVAPPLLPGIN
jgi:prepilin-type N-terminal cleavage/methylation domain-containing protein